MGILLCTTASGRTLVRSLEHDPEPFRELGFRLPSPARCVVERGEQVVLGHDRGVVALHLPKKPTEASEVTVSVAWEEMTAPVYGLAAANRFIVAATAAGIVVLDEGRVVSEHSRNQTCVAVAPLGLSSSGDESVAFVEASGELFAVGLDSGAPVRSLPAVDEGPVRDVAAHPDGGLIAATDRAVWLLAEASRWICIDPTPVRYLVSTPFAMFGVGDGRVVELERSGPAQTYAVEGVLPALAPHILGRVLGGTDAGAAIDVYDGEVLAPVEPAEPVRTLIAHDPVELETFGYLRRDYEDRYAAPGAEPETPRERLVQIYLRTLSKGDKMRLIRKMARDYGLFLRVRESVRWLRELAFERDLGLNPWVDSEPARQLWPLGWRRSGEMTEASIDRAYANLLPLAELAAERPDGPELLHRLFELLQDLDPVQEFGYGDLILPPVLELDRLDDIEWSRQMHCYGAATDVPDQLRQWASDDPEAQEKAHWSLSGSIYHQGSTYPATQVAVPFLVGMLRRPGAERRLTLLSFLRAIAAAESWHARHRNVSFFAEEKDTPAFQGRIAEENHYVDAAAQAVWRGWPVYQELLEDTDARVRASACSSLSDARARSTEARSRLGELALRDPEPGVRGSALDAAFHLARAHDGISSAWRFVERARGDPDPFVRWTAARLALHFGARDGAAWALPVLEYGLDPSPPLEAAARLARDTRPRPTLVGCSALLLLARAPAKDPVVRRLLPVLARSSSWTAAGLARDVVEHALDDALARGEAPLTDLQQSVIREVVKCAERIGPDVGGGVVVGLLGWLLPPKSDRRWERSELTPAGEALLDALAEAPLQLRRHQHLLGKGIPVEPEALAAWLASA